jgi:predicted solute-binding protein
MFRHQNAGQNHDIKTANRALENVAELKYMRMRVTNQNLIQEEIKMRINSCNACYHSVQKLSSYFLLPRNVKIKILKKNSFACMGVKLTVRHYGKNID